MSNCSCFNNGSVIIDIIDGYEIVVCDSCSRTYKIKQEVATIDQMRTELEQVKKENERLKGMKPDADWLYISGMPLPRFGVRWNGPKEPLATVMDDGYWTPWHIADRAIKAVDKGEG